MPIHISRIRSLIVGAAVLSSVGVLRSCKATGRTFQFTAAMTNTEKVLAATSHQVIVLTTNPPPHPLYTVNAQSAKKWPARRTVQGYGKGVGGTEIRLSWFVSCTNHSGRGQSLPSTGVADLIAVLVVDVD